MSEELRKQQALFDDLDSHMAGRETKEAARIIKSLERNERYMADKFNEQYIMYAKAANAIGTEKYGPKMWKMLQKAIRISHRKFNGKNIANIFLTTVDTRIITMMAVYLFEKEEYGRTIDILFGLISNIDNHCKDKIEKGRRYPYAAAVLAKALYKVGRYEDALEVCRKGKDVCIKTNSLWLIPDLIVYEIYTLIEMKDTDTCELLARDAFHMFRVFGRHFEKDTWKGYALDKLGIAL
jgi:tetratricopeptide (TPR) repeat protein